MKTAKNYHHNFRSHRSVVSHLLVESQIKIFVVEFQQGQERNAGTGMMIIQKY